MSSPLHRLAARAGILDGYSDQDGDWRPTEAETRIALLRSLGLPAVTDQHASELLALLDWQERESMLPRSRVVRQDAPDRETFVVHLLPRERNGFRWKAGLRRASDDREAAAGRNTRAEPMRSGSEGTR